MKRKIKRATFKNRNNNKITIQLGDTIRILNAGDYSNLMHTEGQITKLDTDKFYGTWGDFPIMYKEKFMILKKNIWQWS